MKVKSQSEVAQSSGTVNWSNRCDTASGKGGQQQWCLRMAQDSTPHIVFVVQSLSHVGLCNPMDCSMPGFPVLHHLLEFAQTHVHWVSPSHPLSSPAPALNLSQHQSLFQWVGSSHQVAKVLELQLQHPSFQWMFGTDFLYNWLVWSPCCPRDSQESSPALQFKGINSLMLSFFMAQLSHPDRTTGKTIALVIWTSVSKVMSLLLNMLSRFVIAFLTRSKHLLISWLQ